MTTFAIAGIQTHIAATHSNVEHLRHRLDALMSLFPWVQMVVMSELAAFGPNHAHADVLPGPTEAVFQEMAFRHGIWLIPGSMFEQASTAVYNTASVIDPNGEVIGRYRKMFPFRPYEHGVEAGSEFLVFDVPHVGRFGVSICYDMWFPETTRTLTAMGAEVIIHPSMTGTVDRAAELAMAQATAAMFQSYVFDINGLGPGGIGRSIVADPNGTVIFQAGDGEQLIPLEVDLGLVRRTRRSGLHGLGQPLKSFRDRAVDFAVYDRTAFDDGYLRSLGPLLKQGPARHRTQAEAAAHVQALHAAPSEPAKVHEAAVPPVGPAGGHRIA